MTLLDDVADPARCGAVRARSRVRMRGARVRACERDYGS